MEGFGLVMEEGLHLAMTEESQSLFFFCRFDFFLGALTFTVCDESTMAAGGS